MKLIIAHNTSRYVSEDLEKAYDEMTNRCLADGHLLGSRDQDEPWTVRFYTGKTPSGLPEAAPWQYQTFEEEDYAVLVPAMVGGSPMEHLSQELIAALSRDEVKTLMLLLRRADPRLFKSKGMMADAVTRRQVIQHASDVADEVTIRLRPLDKQLRAASRKENGKFKAIRLRQLADSRTQRYDMNIRYELRRRLWLAGTTAAAAEAACRRHGIEGPQLPVSTEPEILDKMRELLELLGG